MRSRRASVAASVAALAALVFLFRRRLARWSPVGRYIVEGASMEPAYRPGERVLVWRWAYRFAEPATGEVVVLEDPERPGHRLVKRVAFCEPQGHLYVLGDHATASRDSRMFGAVPRTLIVGRAWRKY